MSDKERIKEKPREKLVQLKHELDRERRLAAEYKEHLQRLAADFENYRKRVEKEREDFIRFSKEDLIHEFLPILDNFEMALHHVKNTTEPKKIIEGIELVERQFHNILKKEGLEVIETKGKKFNPHIHEAIIHEETNKYSEDLIIKELRKGYILGGKVIRPAQVRVAKHTKQHEISKKSEARNPKSETISNNQNPNVPNKDK
ncbi:nucleotide exchange factor GrpE [bacterium]|nr:nucleotide exchange factor GrpE [bacterium]MBU4561186.1 nucleotide exchange factor GrpE [bacterium]MCG2676692.1 nucleotide exchange factor GrpE [bacterium]MCG2677273.1 nucleotide exchange factor GrpE [bacterium]